MKNVAFSFHSIVMELWTILAIRAESSTYRAVAIYGQWSPTVSGSRMGSVGHSLPDMPVTVCNNQQGDKNPPRGIRSSLVRSRIRGRV